MARLAVAGDHPRRQPGVFPAEQDVDHLLGVTIWWAKTTVATANTTLWVERENVRALKAYAETVKVALDKKSQEVELLRAECERLRRQQTQRP